MSTDKLYVLVVGSGGREHAIAWNLSRSSRVERIYVAPGNGGTESGIDKVSNINIGVSDFFSLTKFAQENNINLVIPGPEQPLVDGIESAFKKIGIPCFGPSSKAAMMEGSKTFAKDFMKRHQIPTATYENFSDYGKAKAYLESVSHKVVLKASGLAGGKGVLIPADKQEALFALKEIMVDKVFGSAGNEVVIEEFLEGQELSILAFSDGYTIVPLPPAQDHKRIFDGDQGPNTGGMGCYCPTPIAIPELIAQIKNEILQPTIDGMRRDGFPFVGMLFTGLMITSSGPKVLEYNVRFGDPETEVVLPLLSDKSDLAEIILACVERRLDSVNIEIKPGFAATVVIASDGYPGSYLKGKEITFNDVPSDTIIFHAGTSIKEGKLVTSGGRVLAVTGVASTLRNAVDKAYECVKSISFDKMYFRKDIAHRAFAYLSQQPAKDNVMTYASAGVSIDSGNLLVKNIKSYVKSTQRPGSDCEIGGFGGLFDLKAAGFNDPILVSTTDGVGTKLKIAQAMNLHDTIGIDLVAMNVNDLIVQGAEPLLFLDYYACGKLEVEVAQNVVKGIADGCLESGCALIGGETSEMPGVYNNGEYDLAGFATGAVERKNVLPRISDIKVDDVLIGITSSGLHSNGFSLVRKIINKYNLEYKSPCPWDSTISLGESLLTPTKIYVTQLLPVVKEGLVKAMAHITGGGFIDNIPRILPKDLGVSIDSNVWELPKVFKWLKENGNIPSDELFRTFNCGIGMVLVVSSDNEIRVKKLLQQYESNVYTIGRVVTKQTNNDKHVVIKGI
ncbi:phosphoribosylamine--glycine ligase [Rhizophagus irregularis]|uniref:Phosphoribosylamine--glycine ligase n=1 Tax=Rhizophagus irregularis TaxID=588596 RepID=A0A2N0PEV6_9GLOM|nr:phosphoribosylamine--glycine ligase [Rhizophagus irregularis]